MSNKKQTPCIWFKIKGSKHFYFDGLQTPRTKSLRVIKALKVKKLEADYRSQMVHFIKQVEPHHFFF